MRVNAVHLLPCLYESQFVQLVCIVPDGPDQCPVYICINGVQQVSAVELWVAGSRL